MTGPTDTPRPEIELDPTLVRGLLAEQHPDLCHLPLAEAASGWDNALYRLGSDLVVRLPRRQVAADLTEHEQRWLPRLAPHLPLPIPTPVRVGGPGQGYPWPWSVARWQPGATAVHAPPGDTAALARSLGGFLRALHAIDPTGAPANAHRGVPLAHRRERTLRAADTLAAEVDVPAVRRSWAHAESLPAWPNAPLLLHGDLHPNNLVVHEGRLSAVIDFGDLTAGDPATDLAIAWMLLDPAARDVLREEVTVDDDTWGRSRGWALSLGLTFLAHSADDPAFAEVGRRTIVAVLEDSDP